MNRRDKTRPTAANMMVREKRNLEMGNLEMG